LALKSLGKHASGSKVIAAPANLSTLLSLSMSLEDPEASLEALRCVANALLLIESARVVWVGNEVEGGVACVGLLEVIRLFPSLQVLLLGRLLPFRNPHRLVRYSWHLESCFFALLRNQPRAILYVGW
jgi:hypothetical protein